MPDPDENRPEQSNQLDISEYIPGNDLTEDREVEPGMDEAQRKAIRNRRKLRRNIIKGIMVLILAVLLLSVGIELNRDVPVLVQYIFLYFLFEAVFAENRIVLALSFGMLVLFGLFLTGILGLLPFMFLTFVSLLLFLRCEKRIWLQVMNLLVLGTWGLMMIITFLGLRR